MQHLIGGLAAAILLVPALALAQQPPQRPRGAPEPARSSGDFWVSLGAGAYTGEEYDQPPNTDHDAYHVGGYSTHASINMASERLLVRVRASWLADYTSNSAEEVAGVLGLAFGPDRRGYLGVGVSRLTDVSNTEQGPTLGVPIELAIYPARGLEIMIHGNVNDDSNFIGIAISGVIGKDRAR